MRLLALCTHNSARSQMAEGWLRHLAQRDGLELDVRSAGTTATRVAPEAIRVMAEVGIDLSGHTSTSLHDLSEPLEVDLVLTVCDDAKEACPVLPGAARTLHASFPDPSGADLPFWRDVRDTIGATCERLIRALARGRVPTEQDLRPG